MNTIESILTLLTSDALVADVKAVLREQDPEYPSVETAFQEAVCALASKIGKEEAEKLLASKERQILSDLVYTAYLGFQANLANFHNPMASQFTKLDYDVFLREHIMQTLPCRAAAEKTIAAFRETYKDALSEYDDAIQSYYIYLAVAGQKLAHFWGYVFANRFLPWVEPGYVSDGAQTSIYALELHRDLGFRVR
ncbi:MAG: hypothetical protein MR828_11505 [Clostridiales bacterium]|nr:hypothetical protein [Clostridiales bacterium]